MERQRYNVPYVDMLKRSLAVQCCICWHIPHVSSGGETDNHSVAYFDIFHVCLVTVLYMLTCSIVPCRSLTVERRRHSQYSMCWYVQQDRCRSSMLERQRQIAVYVDMFNRSPAVHQCWRDRYRHSLVYVDMFNRSTAVYQRWRDRDSHSVAGRDCTISVQCPLLHRHHHVLQSDHASGLDVTESGQHNQLQQSQKVCLENDHSFFIFLSRTNKYDNWW